MIVSYRNMTHFNPGFLQPKVTGNLLRRHPLTDSPLIVPDQNKTGVNL